MTDCHIADHCTLMNLQLIFCHIYPHFCQIYQLHVILITLQYAVFIAIRGIAINLFGGLYKFLGWYKPLILTVECGIIR